MTMTPKEEAEAILASSSSSTRKTTSSPVTRATLSPDENLIVGMVGGTLETLILMPVITYKFCKQEGRPYPRFPGMYRGVAVQAGSVAPLTAIQMVFNGLLESGLKTVKSASTLSDTETIACAMGAGVASAVLYSPVDLVMIHQQKMHLAPLQTVSALAKSHGVFGLFRGFFPCAMREALYSAGYLGLAPVFTKKIMQQKGWEDSYYLSSLLGATTAGIISNLSSHPIDTVKTVMQADMTKTKYSNSVQTLTRLLKEQGATSLFKGGFARTFRGCGAFFIVSSIREQCIQNKSNYGSPWAFTSQA